LVRAKNTENASKTSGFCIFRLSTLENPVAVLLQISQIRLPLHSYFTKDMANHKSAEKRIRANDAKRVRNRYQHKTTRTAIKNLRSATVKTEAVALLKEVSSMIDKLLRKTSFIGRKLLIRSQSDEARKQARIVSYYTTTGFDTTLP
jgi:small subunit ribosomal protein S20